MFDDTTTYIGSLSDEDGTSPRLDAYPRTQMRDVDEDYELDGSTGGSNGRPLKKQRVGPTNNKFSRKEPMRIEKCASNGKVYITNKPKFPVKLLPDSHDPKKVAENQAMLQKQLRLSLAESEKLRAANTKLAKDNKILEEKMCIMQRHNVELMTMANSFRAQSRKMRDGLDARGQGPANYPIASAPPIHRQQEDRGSLTGAESHTAAPPTEPRVLPRTMDRSSSPIMGTQTQETGHSFGIERLFTGRHLPIQNLPRHKPEMEGPRMDTAQ
jgi:hypothetical protein